jgi:hypothetical protein
LFNWNVRGTSSTQYFVNDLRGAPVQVANVWSIRRSRQRVRDQVALLAFGAETRMRSNARG